jgi:hypothetical protein
MLANLLANHQSSPLNYKSDDVLFTNNGLISGDLERQTSNIEPQHVNSKLKTQNPKLETASPIFALQIFLNASYPEGHRSYYRSWRICS